MTLTARLTAAADLMEAVGALNVPVPIDVLRQILEILKEKEATNGR